MPKNTKTNNSITNKQTPTNPNQTTTSPDQQQFDYKYFKLDTSKLVSLMKKDLQATQEGTAFLSHHKKEDIMRYLQSPVASEKILRQISNLLYNLSPQYKRLLHYFADMSRFDHVLNINNFKTMELPKEKILDKYLKTAKYIDVMNIKHEFNKITKTIFIEDVFYGYAYMTDHSFTIQKLNSDFCRINGVADSIKTYQFDFTFFNSIKNRELLDTYYAPEFKEKYELYKTNSKDYRWQELSLENSVCIKLQEELEYPIPFFASIFPDVFDLADAKLLYKAHQELQNFCVLVAKIPYLKSADHANSFALHLDDGITFANKAMQSLPEGVGFLLSPYEEVDPIFLGDKSQVNKNYVAETENSLFSSAGVNQVLFNSDKITEQSIRSSISVDENLVFGLYRQFERFINLRLKLCLDDNFKIKILDTTFYNYGEVFKRYKEAAIYGACVKREMIASLGVTPLEMQSSMVLENEVLELQNWVPLTSANTLSPDKTNNGRPSQNAEGGDGTTGKQQGEE